MSKRYALKGRDGEKVRRLSAQHPAGWSSLAAAAVGLITILTTVVLRIIRNDPGSGTVRATTSEPEKQNSSTNEPVKSNSSFDMLKLADLLKLSALTGFLLYVALFLGYYRYYQDLGLRPEDLGVSNTYILVRSTGFVACMVVLFALLAVIYWQNSKMGRSKSSTTRAKLFRLAIVYFAGSLLGLLTIFLTPSDWPFWVDWIVGGVICMIIVIAFLFANRKRFERWAVFAVPALLLSVLLPATSVAARANDIAHQVLEGRQVSPWLILNVPILDVSAKYADVTWIGPTSQRPAIFGKNPPESIHGLLLGDGSGTVVHILISDNHELRIVHLPSSLVMVESGS